jgi:hypothetical protein
MDRSVLRRVAVTVFSGWVLFASIALAERYRVPGTHVTIKPPAGFSPAEQFPGFYRADIGASIMVTELPGPLGEVGKGMTKEGLAARGMILLESQTVQVEGREAFLLKVKQQAAGVEFLKWFLAAGDERGTTLVVGTFPSSAAKSLSEPVRLAVLSAAWDRQAQVDVFEGLLYRLEPSPNLKIANRVNNMIMLNETGSPGPLGPGEPFYIAGNAVAEIDIPDLQAFSRARAVQTVNLSEVRNVKGRSITVDGLDAYELLADATHKDSGTPIQLYQVIAPAGRSFFIFQGFVKSVRAAEFLAEFRRITDTFRRVQP